MKERITSHDRACTYLKDKFGETIYNSPNYRIVRSDGRLEYFGADKGYVPKYPQYHCWILEKWCPPEQYGSKAAWQAADLGEYPSHGDYEIMWAFEKCDDFSDHQIEWLAWAINQNRNLTRSDRWSRIREREAEAKRKERERIFDIVHDAAPKTLSGYREPALAPLDIPKGSSTLKGIPNV